MNDKIHTAFSLYLKQLVEQKQNRFKQKACRDILNGLKKYENEIITTSDIVDFMQFLGKKNAKKTIQRIEIILLKGHLPDVTTYHEEYRDNTKENAIESLCTIYGIGPSKALSLYMEYDLHSINELKHALASDSDIPLTKSQKLGVDYYTDLQSRIPRNEITYYRNILRDTLKLIDPKAKLCIAGSYRRGKPDSGDIDVLICSRTLNLQQFVKAIHTHIVGVLAKGDKKCMLLTRLEKFNIVRHMDIILTQPKQYAFAQLYFTGSKDFNIKMRAFALSKGYSMNEYGLTPVQKQEPVIPVLYTEKSIFTFLNYNYCKPSDR
tara:strand:+ start:734 stop:1696 length:963 start_codon:yes stop_codon:yes gene_type:complete